MNEPYYTKAEIDEKHDLLMTTINSELQGMQSVQNSENIKMRDSMQGLATKEDVKEVITFMKNINFGVGIFKWSIHSVVFVGSLIAAIGAILIVVKFGLGALISWALIK